MQTVAVVTRQEQYADTKIITVFETREQARAWVTERADEYAMGCGTDCYRHRRRPSIYYFVDLVPMGGPREPHPTV